MQLRLQIPNGMKLTVNGRIEFDVTSRTLGTGLGASPHKIAVMNDALGKHPLAIASGVISENVGSYLNNADCLLVATGISKNFEELDPIRVAALIEAVR